MQLNINNKGGDAVIFNKHYTVYIMFTLHHGDYINSMNKIILDASKFAVIDESSTKFSLKIEDKINVFLPKLKNFKSISDDTYKKLRVTGSCPGILYGLPKI